MSEEKKDEKKEEKKDAADQGKEAAQEAKGKIGTGKKVLIVEDDPGCQELLKKILSGEEFEVFTTADGNEGVQIANRERPELIIADVLMPAMAGLDFFKELKRSKQTAKIQVLITSVRSKMEDTFLALGAQGFIPKPIDTVKLLELIRSLTLVPIPLILDDDEEEDGAEKAEGASEEAPPAEEKKE